MPDLELYSTALCPFAHRSRLMAWWDAVANRKAVRAIAKSTEFYLEQYAYLAKLYEFFK